MARIFLLLMALLYVPRSSAEWFWQNPLPQGNHLYAVTFTDGNTGVAAGDFGTVLRTTDAGTSWRV